MMINNRNKRLVLILTVIPVLLLIPFVAMYFTNEVNWQLMDFVVAGILLSGSGLTLEFILRKIKSRKNKIILVITLLILLVLIWAELAVGLFGSVVL